MQLFGILEDNIGMLILHWRPQPFTVSSEPLFYTFYQILSNYIDSIFLYNLLVFLTWIFLIFFSFKFFSMFFNDRFISICLSLVFSFSPYFYYHMQSHLVLTQFWIVLIYLIFLVKIFLKESKVFDFIFIGTILAILALTSNYLGFFSIVFTLLYFLIYWMFTIKETPTKFYKYIFGLLTIFLTFLTIFFTFNFRFLNILLNPNYQELSTNLKIVTGRPIEDFFIFSSRPWYYILPSIDNPFFGELSSKLILDLQSNWGIFLTDNYFKSEHSSSFLGISNLIIGFAGLLFLINSYKKNINTNYFEIQAIILSIVCLALVLFTMPPYLTFFGKNIYSPSYLIYEFFPMFRVTSRLGVFVLLLWLILVGFGYKVIFSYLRKREFSNLKIRIIFLFMVTISLLEFYIPPKFINFSDTPDVFRYIKENLNPEDKIVVYPHSKTKESLFWSKYYSKDLINTYGAAHNIDEKIITNVEFTENLTTCKGIYDAIGLGATFLVFFPNEAYINGDFSFISGIEEVFRFENISQQEYNASKFWTIQNIGNNHSNVAILYKLPKKLEDLNCLKEKLLF